MTEQEWRDAVLARLERLEKRLERLERIEVRLGEQEEGLHALARKLDRLGTAVVAALEAGEGATTGLIAARSRLARLEGGVG